jgi:PHP family Zn ribbon phosphoesterase
MNTYLADLHIHSVASPCSDLDMSPVRIADAAVKAGLQVIALTDHNTTANCRTMIETGNKKGLLVIPGSEVTTAEEIHCLCYFDNPDVLDTFENLLQNALPPVKNDPSKFGYQLVVNENEEILRSIDTLLLSATDFTLNKLETLVHELGGIIVPAHADRPSFSILSQLGFFPLDFYADAIELANTGHQNENTSVFPGNIPWISSSDSHYIHMIGTKRTAFLLEELSINAIFNLIRNANHDCIIPQA